MNIHQTEAHGRFLELIGWQVLRHRYKETTTYYFLRKILFLPIYFLKIQRLPLELIDWKFVEKIKAKNRVVETVIEIDQMDPSPVEMPELVEKNYVPARDFMLTTKTRMIDLEKSELQLIKAMKPKTRYNIKKSEDNNLIPRIVGLEEVVKNYNLFEQYYELLKQNARRIGMLLIPKSWILKQWQAFGKNGFVIEIRKKEELLAIATFYVSDNTCSYNLNGSTERGRKFFAPSMAVWEGMREGKRRGLKLFDFDGVCDERYPKTQKRFAGFGRFKAGFGGEEVYFPPMYRKNELKKLFDPLGWGE